MSRSLLPVPTRLVRLAVTDMVVVVVVMMMIVVTMESAILVVAASSTSSSSSYYTSMRSLDKFGNAIQLKHAREAALRHGRLVVAAIPHRRRTTRTTSTTITHQQDHQQEEPPHQDVGKEQGTVIVVISVGNRPLVSSLTLPLSSNGQNNPDLQSRSSPSSQQQQQEEGEHGQQEPEPEQQQQQQDGSNHVTAMCCTGIKSDADWFTRQIQTYISQIWERYNLHPLHPLIIAYWMGRILTNYQYNSEDIDMEWQTSILGRQQQQRRSRDDEDSMDTSISRPLGIQTFLLSTIPPSLSSSMTTKNGGGSDERLLLIEPTGRIFQAESTDSFSFLTMGKESERFKEALLRWRGSSSSSSTTDPTTTTSTSTSSTEATPIVPSTTTSVESLEELLIQELLTLLEPTGTANTKTNSIEFMVERVGRTKIESILVKYQNGILESRTTLR